MSEPTGDGRLVVQQSRRAAWQKQDEERDIVAVVLDGSRADGVADAAAAICTRDAVPAVVVAVAVVGKDGHVAWRASQPVSGRGLEEVIDAIPVRRAGQR